MKKLRAFTLIEVLVVVTIIGMLAAIGSVSYSSFTRNARDAKRKADLENIRSAVELYRSNNGSYPLTAELIIDCVSPSTNLVDPAPGTGTYMSKIPTDPKCPTNAYGYESDGADYTLGAAMENDTVACTTAPSTGCNQTCTYCVGPYGER